MGESMLHPLFPQIIKLFKRKLTACRFYISTNGSIYNGLRCCVDNDIDSVKISLNCNNKKQHESTVGVDDFDLIVSNIKRTFEYRNATKSRTWLSFSSINSIFSTYDNAFITQMSRYVDECYMTPIYNHAGKVNIASMKDAVVSTQMIDTSTRCPCVAMYTMCHIKCNGDINLCRFGIDDGHTIGNIMTSNLKDIWFNDKAMKLRERARRNELSTCNNCIHVS